MTDFENIEYLKKGNSVQRQVFEIMSSFQILHRLAAYTPIIAGSIPINVNTGESDIDIICSYSNKEMFKDDLKKLFIEEHDFIIRESLKHQEETVIVNFRKSGFDFEIFGQKVPTRQQMGYRHLVIEYKLLLQHGEALRAYVLEQKQKGMKTEPAFCKWLGIEGDAYTELLKLENI